MNQADVTKLMSRLRIKYKPVRRRLKNPEGAEGRLKKIRKTLTALINHERIELNYNRADETRGYAERLISDAIRYGDCHLATMELADYWLLEKQLIHKLFKVLVPRFENCPVSYTRMYRAPRPCPGMYYKRAVIELRDHGLLGYDAPWMYFARQPPAFWRKVLPHLQGRRMKMEAGVPPILWYLSVKTYSATSWKTSLHIQCCNPYPPLLPDMTANRNLIHNVLLDEAHKEFRAQKYAEIAKKLEAANDSATKSFGDGDEESSSAESSDEDETNLLGEAQAQPPGEKVVQPSQNLQ